jgi:hypothetical protein
METLSLETSVELPQYETPSVSIMTEEEILKSFQTTQAMAGWWNAVITPCTC